MRLAVEEAITIRYMLRSLGIKVSEPSNTIGDNDSITTVSPFCKDCYGSDGDNNDMFLDFWSYVLEFIKDHPHHDHSKQWD